MLLPFTVHDRRRETAPGTSLGALADALSSELDPWLATPLPIPEVKARLTRAGGRCPVHGTPLEFDPWQPHRHRCEPCGTCYTDAVHHEWWAMGAQLFTAERTVHAAALFLLRGRPAHRDLAIGTLRDLAQRYRHWPNRDNVLGPTRPFFSTYLESIWLLNLCHALALLEAAGVHDSHDTVREQLLAPSSALIAGYHEGRSNRQVWNEVAVLSAWTLLGDRARVEARLSRPGSLESLMRHGLLADGTWYEGENYHQFAHRGLWYGVQLLAARGRPLDPVLDQRYHEGFVTPFAGLLPDETLPSRRDSQYAVSVRQWRWAEWCELGLAHRHDERLAAVLQRLYDGRAPQRETGRALSTADAERNRPAAALTRADCSWRALLMAAATPTPNGHWTPGSLVQPQQGLAVLRRAGEGHGERERVYVALDGGASAGGHGHPDRLHLTLQSNAARWLDDPGTGSYVDPTLHWYRSTLAHHAPLVNGASQQEGRVTLTAFEDRGGAGWVQKRAEELAPGVQATRTVVVCDGYLVDLLEWTAAEPVTLTLPVAAGDATNIATWRAAARAGAGGTEDGYDFLRQIEAAADAPNTITVAPHAAGDAHRAVPRAGVTAVYATSGEPCWWRALAPGAPGRSSHRRLFVDLHGTAGRIVGVWSWVPIAQVTLAPTGPVYATVTTPDGTMATHESAAHGWHIGLVARHARSSIDLERLPVDTHAGDARDTHDALSRHAAAPHAASALRAPLGATVDHVVSEGPLIRLGEAHYTPTEEPWGGDNRPTAEIRVGVTRDLLVVHLQVHTGHPPVVPEGGTATRMPDNLLDNERADVNADGVQVYVGMAGDPTGRWRAGVLAVPLQGHEGATVRLTSLVPGGPVPQARAIALTAGWELTMQWPRALLPALESGTVTFDVVVNERPPHRERRRGQLVLSGGGGFGYLRGDRHAPAHPLWLQLG
ncbi:heparinase II/III family protein [Gemmatimonas sp.]|jgi:hypothetical protein|uniref:heparinase II/III domain-containing protein n=1 Tax=Gemmatimonas sp. TaxID=1962908 RepID=UPI0037BF3BE7